MPAKLILTVTGLVTAAMPVSDPNRHPESVQQVRLLVVDASTAEHHDKMMEHTAILSFRAEDYSKGPLLKGEQPIVPSVNGEEIVYWNLLDRDLKICASRLEKCVPRPEGSAGLAMIWASNEARSRQLGQPEGAMDWVVPVESFGVEPGDPTWRASDAGLAATVDLSNLSGTIRSSALVYPARDAVAPLVWYFEEGGPELPIANRIVFEADLPFNELLIQDGAEAHLLQAGRDGVLRVSVTNLPRTAPLGSTVATTGLDHLRWIANLSGTEMKWDAVRLPRPAKNQNTKAGGICMGTRYFYKTPN